MTENPIKGDSRNIDIYSSQQIRSSAVKCSIISSRIQVLSVS